MFGGALQPVHLIIILVIILIVFGPGKLPDIGASLGKSLTEFKKAVSGDAVGAASPTATASVCPACHTENAAGNKFCGKCGEKLG